MNDYDRMARIIRYLDERYTEQPSLDELAAAAHLSPSHFHRLFSSLVGVTPKDFVQCLTIQHAKDLLLSGESVLDASLNSGLSGPGRLHDLCVTMEAGSPGELKNLGNELNINYGYTPSPFGDCLVAQTQRGICHLAFVENDSRESALAALSTEWSKARLIQNDNMAAELIDKIFTPKSNKRKPDQLSAWVKGSKFQMRVWRALLKVPFGQLMTYGQLAANIGQPKAARAVGTAVAGNPLALLIPCHRVIRDTGVTGQYRWGAGRKRALIAWESATSSVAPKSKHKNN